MLLWCKITELDNWKQHVYREVPYYGQHFICLRSVCSLKETNAGFVPKAQLVAKGFEDNDKNNVSKESPTCLKQSLRVLVALSSQQNWKLNAIDIKTAFLLGQPIFTLFQKKQKQIQHGNLKMHIRPCWCFPCLV